MKDILLKDATLNDIFNHLKSNNLLLVGNIYNLEHLEERCNRFLGYVPPKRKLKEVIQKSNNVGIDSAQDDLEYWLHDNF